MGKVAKVALAAAAPEAAVAGKAAKAAGGTDPRRTAPGSTAAQQRQAIEDIKARRPAPPPAGPGHPMIPAAASASPPPASPGGGPSLPGMPAAAATGSGFLLGVFAWAVALAYLQHGGVAGVH